MDGLTHRLGKLLAWLPLAMALITIVIVVLRYAFAQGSIALQETVMYAHGIAVLLGLGYALKEDSHVRVDLLYSKFSRGQSRQVNLFGHWMFLLPVSAMLFWVTVPYATQSWRVLEGSSEVGGLPGVFLLKTLLPTAAAYLFLQGLAEIVRQYLQADSDTVG